MADWQNRIIGLEWKPANQLLANPKNPRRHPAPQREALRGSLDGLGWYDVVIENRATGELLDGHARIEEALTKDENAQVPVLIVDLDPHEQDIAIASHDFMSSMAATDTAILDSLLKDLHEEELVLPVENEMDSRLREMLSEMAQEHGLTFGDEPDEPEDPGAQIDKAAELQEKWQVETGDLWIIGDHRLLCGDSTNADDVARVMGGSKADAVVTDPPYGINIVGKNSTAGNFPGTLAPRLKASPIVGDDKPFDPTFLLSLAPKIVLWGANHYANKLPSSSRWLVWDKKDGAFQDSDLGDCELAWTNLSGAARLLHHTWQGMYRKGEGERTARTHPTQKAVDLMKWCIEQIDVGINQIVFDPFGGSGTTMIAAAILNRVCFMIEIHPPYCAVILQRMTDFGLTPVRAE